MWHFRATVCASLLAAALGAGCALAPEGLPANGFVGGQRVEIRVDSEAARYYLANYLAGERRNDELDARIDDAYRNASNALPDRDELRRLSEEFSIDFAALYFADKVSRDSRSRLFRQDFETARAYVRRSLSRGDVELARPAAAFEIVFVPGYLYRRHPATGADFAGPRAMLRRVGFPHYFVATDEDGPIDANAELLLAALRARAGTNRRLIVVSASKAGPEVALALTKLGTHESHHIAAWINIVGVLQGTPLADEGLLQDIEELVGRVDVAGLDSITTAQSRRRFDDFRIRKRLLVVNYMGTPLVHSVSSLAQRGFQQLRKYGPNDGLSLLPDLIFPGGLTVAELGRDHFLLDDEIDITTLALTITIVRWLEKN